MEWISWVWIGFILFNSILDLFKKKISLVSCGIGMLIGVCFFVYQSLGNRESSEMGIIIQLIFRLLPGLLVMGISILSCQAIGMGDGCVLLVTGIFWGVGITIEIFFWALISSSVAGILYMIIKKVNKKTEIPFVPFLLLGYLLRTVWF